MKLLGVCEMVKQSENSYQVKKYGDMKHFRAQESVHVTRMTTYLIVAVLLAVLSWMFERDNHPFNDLHYVQVEGQSCEKKSDCCIT